MAEQREDHLQLDRPSPEESGSRHHPRETILFWLAVAVLLAAAAYIVVYNVVSNVRA